MTICPLNPTRTMMLSPVKKDVALLFDGVLLFVVVSTFWRDNNELDSGFEIQIPCCATIVQFILSKG